MTVTAITSQVAFDLNEKSSSVAPIPAKAAAGPDDDFWSSAPESIVFQHHEQLATAIYFNRDNALVIRQREPFEKDDQYIIIAASNIEEFIDKLTDACGISVER